MGNGVESLKLTVGSIKSKRSLAPCRMNLSGLMTLSDVLSFWVDTIFQGSCNPQSLLHGEVDVLFDIPLIGLFKAV